MKTPLIRTRALPTRRYAPAEVQRRCIEQYPVGSHVYIRGCALWQAIFAAPGVGAELSNLGMKSSFQGENCIYLGNGRLYGFWQDPETRVAGYSAKSYDEIIDALYTRTKANFDSLPKEKQKEVLKVFYTTMSEVCFLPNREDKLLHTVKPFDIVGVEHADEIIILR